LEAVRKVKREKRESAPSKRGKTAPIEEKPIRTLVPLARKTNAKNKTRFNTIPSRAHSSRETQAAQSKVEVCFSYILEYDARALLFPFWARFLVDKH